LSYASDDLDTSRGSKSSEESHTQGSISLGKAETRAVGRLRCFLLLLLILAVGAAVAVFLFVRRAEEDEFEDDFLRSQGPKVLEGFQDDVFRKLQAMDSLSSTLTSYALNNGQAWPFVTMPDVAYVLEPYRSLTNAVSLNVLPIVGARQRLQWEDYVVQPQNQAWLDLSSNASDVVLGKNRLLLDDQVDAHEQKQGSSNFNRVLQTTKETIRQDERELQTVSSYIKNYVGVDTSQGPWIVAWMYAPVIPNRWFVNFNQLASQGFEQAADRVLSHKAVIGQTWTFTEGLDFQSTRDFDFTRELLSASGFGNYQAGEVSIMISLLE